MKRMPNLLTAAAVGLVATLAWSGVQAADVGEAKGDTSMKRIALSNSYAGNSWRQAMLKAWNSATADAIKAHVIKEVKVVNANSVAKSIRIDLAGERTVAHQATLITLSGKTPNATNSITHPDAVKPVARKVPVAGPKFTQTFAPYSVNVLELSY